MSFVLSVATFILPLDKKDNQYTPATLKLHQINLKWDGCILSRDLKMIIYDIDIGQKEREIVLDYIKGMQVQFNFQVFSRSIRWLKLGIMLMLK